jgi:hypothetical protein
VGNMGALWPGAADVSLIIVPKNSMIMP